MPGHKPEEEENSHSPEDWEWIGNDGLTDRKREAMAERYWSGPGRNLAPEEIDALRSLAQAGMLTKMKVEELPGPGRAETGEKSGGHIPSAL